MTDCKSPFQPVPSGYTTVTYDMCYNIVQNTTIPKIFTQTTTANISVPKLIIGDARKCKKTCVPYVGCKEVCQSYKKPYIGTGTLSLTVGSFQATPTFNVTASGQMSASITTGTKIVTNGNSLTGSVLYTANLNLKSFTLNIKVQSQGDGYFFNNYGFALNLPLYFSTQYIPAPITPGTNVTYPILFPGKSADIPRTPLQPITIYDVIPTTSVADALCSLNMSVDPVITGGKVTTNWIFCSDKNGNITLGGTATMTINIEAPGYFNPKPITILGETLNPGKTYFTNYKNTITQNFDIPATQLTVVQTTPGPPPGPIPPTPPTPPTPPVPSIP